MINIKKYILLNASLTLAILLFACTTPNKPQASLEDRSLIPAPVSVEKNEGTFEITESTVLYVDNDAALQAVADSFVETIANASGIKLKTTSSTDDVASGIVFKISSEVEGEEGYKLNVNENLVTLSASTAAGAYRGIQTLKQLLPSEIASPEVIKNIRWVIPGVNITDYPQYSYRGSMLDMSRHFFTVDEVKRYIDLMAAYKLNVLHMHLTDDQGWRIEIKSWPKLTEIGASKEVGGGEGGFYTQEDYKEIVAYAQERYITIIPEIDMPGHTNAALASYPELNCDGKAPELYTGTEVGFSSFCIDKEITYTFIEDVIKEIIAITPGEYIHIGGDESHSTELEDYIPFVTRVQDMVYKHGKTPIGWDEIRHAELKESTVVQFWANKENAQEAVKQGSKVLISPASKAYLDMKYDSISPLGLSWAGLINVKTGYDWNPSTLVEGVGKDNIFGVEAPLWAETLETIDDIEYMVIPRLLGYAEIGWSQDSSREWDTYKVRLGKHYNRFKLKNINFYESEMVPWDKGAKDSIQ